MRAIADRLGDAWWRSSRRRHPRTPAAGRRRRAGRRSGRGTVGDPRSVWTSAGGRRFHQPATVVAVVVAGRVVRCRGGRCRASCDPRRSGNTPGGGVRSVTDSVRPSQSVNCVGAGHLLHRARPVAVGGVGVEHPPALLRVCRPRAPSTIVRSPVIVFSPGNKIGPSSSIRSAMRSTLPTWNRRDPRLVTCSGSRAIRWAIAEQDQPEHGEEADARRHGHHGAGERGAELDAGNGMVAGQSGLPALLWPTPRAPPSVRPDREKGTSRSMDLFEYQGKQYFARYDIPVSAGGAAVTVDEAVAQADEAGYPVVVKAQVQVGGRGKAGGIKLANDADEVRLHAGNILGMDIKGHVVKTRLDRARQRHRRGVLRQLHARPGGQEAPAHAVGPGWCRDRGGRRRRTPRRSSSCTSTRSTGLTWPTARQAAVDAKIPAQALDGTRRHPRQALRLLHRGRLRPGGDQPADPQADRRGARPRRQGQPRQQRRVPPSRSGRSTRRPRSSTPASSSPARRTSSTSASTASVGIIANGAGLAMSTLDVVNQVGGTAANFLDIGGGANADVMAAALEVINYDEKVKSIFINIFGGITRGEEVAKGIVEALAPRRPAGPDRHPARRHQRRGGSPDPRSTPASPRVEAHLSAHHARCRPRRPSPSQERN